MWRLSFLSLHPIRHSTVTYLPIPVLTLFLRCLQENMPYSLLILGMGLGTQPPSLRPDIWSLVVNLLPLVFTNKVIGKLSKIQGPVLQWASFNPHLFFSCLESFQT